MISAARSRCSTTTVARSAGGIVGRMRWARRSASRSMVSRRRTARSRFVTETRSSRSALPLTSSVRTSPSGLPRSPSRAPMADLSLGALRRDGEAFMEALTREQHLALAGYKPIAELRPIYERFAHVLGTGALELTRDAFRSAAEGTDEWRSARALLNWEVESHASRALAELDERIIAWEVGAVVRLADGREVPYQRAAVELSTQTDRNER